MLSTCMAVSVLAVGAGSASATAPKPPTGAVRHLARRVSVAAEQASLADVVALLKRKTRAPLVLDSRGVGRRRRSAAQTRVTLDLQNVSLASVLQWLRWQAPGVGYRFDPGRLLVTSRQRALANEQMQRRTETALAQADLLTRPEHEAEVRAVLARKVTCRLAGKPLAEAVDWLRQVSGMNIVLDTAALADEGLTTQTPVHLDLADATLESVINALVNQIGFTALTEHEALLLTSRTRAASGLVTRLYPTADLAPWLLGLRTGEAGMRSAVPRDQRPLVRLIGTVVYPNSWRWVGGHGRVEPFEGDRSLLVVQTRLAHDRIGRLLDALRRVPELQKAIGAGGAPVGWLAVGDGAGARQRIEQALDKPAGLTVPKAELRDLLARLHKATGVGFVLDMPALQEESVEPKLEVSFESRSTPLRAALARLLGPLNLTTMIAGDALLVTSRTRVRSELATRVYPVADLAPRAGNAASFAVELIDMVGESAGAWNAPDAGAAFVALLPHLTFVVTHTPAVHDRIAKELNDLRKQLAP